MSGPDLSDVENLRRMNRNDLEGLRDDDTPAHTQSSTQSSTQSPAEAEVAGAKWASRSDIERAILEIAAPDFVTAEALARRLNRSVRTLRENYLNQLVGEGKLELRFPDKLTSPGQAYRSKRGTP